MLFLASKSEELNWVSWDWEVQPLSLDVFSLSTFLLPPPCFSWCYPEYKWRLMLLLEQGCLHAISSFHNIWLVPVATLVLLQVQNTKIPWTYQEPTAVNFQLLPHED